MQKNITLLILFICLFIKNVSSQQLPINTCGIVNIYDAAGNRTKRQYFCNNGAPYPSRIATLSTTEEYQQVDALYPNPTTGKFSVNFSKALKGAEVFVTDVNGKVVSRFKASGNKIDFDLSLVTNGIYFIRINDAGNKISKKVVKQ